MASSYQDKQCRRQRELNSRRGSHQFDDRRDESRQHKRQKLVQENEADDFDSASSWSLISNAESPSWSRASSTSSNRDAMDMDQPVSMLVNVDHLMSMPLGNQAALGTTFSPVTEVQPTNSELDLARWIHPTESLFVTPLDQRHKYPNAMRNRCRLATPRVDQTIWNDLQRAFGYPPADVLSKIVSVCYLLPFWIRDAIGQLVQQAELFRAIHHLDEKQLEWISRINQQITLRASYGALFVKGDRFFARTIPNRKQRRSAIKGYPISTAGGEMEHPWQTARRMTAQQVQYWNGEQKEWQRFDLDEHVNQDDRQEYLECLVTGVQNTDHLRYIGLFIIRLKPDVRIGVYGSNQAEGQDNWYSVKESLTDNTFYTIRPFLKYLDQ